MIANSGHDERGKYRGGQPGDQTGGEWAVIPWYSRPWNVVLRFPRKAVAADIAYCARAAAGNDKIGYNQGARASFWKALSTTANYDPAKVSELCDSDCTCGAATCVKAAGLRHGYSALADIDPDYVWSGNMKSYFKNLGFQVLTDSKYLTSDRYLLPGDILLLENHHAAVNLDVGSMVREQWDDVPIYTTGWHRDDRGWWYAKSIHHYAKDEWVRINSHWYYFDSEGYAVKGYQKIGDAFFFFEPEAGHPYECALMNTDAAGALKVWDLE